MSHNGPPAQHEPIAAAAGNGVLGNDMFRMLVEGVRDYAIFLLNPQGIIISWNVGAQRTKGYAAHEIIGHHFSRFYTADALARDWPAEELRRARRDGRLEDEGWRVRKDGTRFWANVIITPMFAASGDLLGYSKITRDRAGMVRGFVHIVRDLTERRRVQELETEGQRINEFIAMLAHELRNPLAPIGNAVGIMEKVATSPQLTWCAQLIGRQLGHLTRLVDDLLDASRITSGKIQLRIEPLVLNEVVASAIDSVRPVIAGYGHTLDVSLHYQPIGMTGDPTRLTQVVVNLLNNAAKYTPNGGRIALRLERYGALATIRVVDNGIGMSPQLVEAAFELFIQGDRTLDRAEGGLGIGLPLVRRIANLHGGTVTAHSAGPGRGSEFTVLLPVGPIELN